MQHQGLPLSGFNHAGTSLIFPGTLKDFIVGEHFRVDVSKAAVVKICSLNDMFRRELFHHRESQSGKSSIEPYDFTDDRDSLVDQVVAATPGEMSFAAVWHALCLREQGGIDIFHRNKPTVFYTRGRGNELHVVGIRVSEHGAVVEAISTRGQWRWDQYRLLISRSLEFQ